MISLELAAIPWPDIQKPAAAKAWAKKAPIKDVERVIRLSKDSYYNSSNEKIPDSAFDEIEDQLKKRAPSSPALIVGAEVKSELKEVPLSVWMGSQNKVKSPETLQRFLTKNPAPSYTVTAKLDGKAYLYENVKGRFKLTSRGKGDRGTDLSFLLPSLRLPKIPVGMKVRGEIMMSPAKWQAKWSKDKLGDKAGFTNERALVAGVTNSKSLHPALRDLDIFAFEVIDGGTQEQQIKTLTKLGFRVPPNIVIKSPTFKELMKIIKDLSTGLFRIDGLVIAANVPYKGVTSGNPTHSTAFKPTRESGFSLDTEATFEIDHIEWNVTRLSKFAPRVVLKPQRLDGVKINHANGHNAKFIIDNKLGPGALVTVVRSGQVIPYITGIVKSAKVAQMPSVPYEMDGVHAVVKAKTSKSQAKGKWSLVEVHRAVHFFSTLGIKGVQQGTIIKLFDAGYTLETLLPNAYEEDYVRALGVNGKKIYTQVEDVYIYPPTLDWLLDAAGIFGGLGQRNFSKIVEVMPNLLVASPKQITDTAQGIHGWGDEMVKKLLAGLPAFKEFMTATGLKASKPVKVAPVKTVSKKLAGQVILMTKFRDQPLVADIIKNGGTITENYSTKVTIVLAPSGKTSNKTDRAEEQGIPVMDPGDFRKKYKV